MTLTFGILSLILGGVLTFLSVPRLLFVRATRIPSRNFAIKMLIGGVLLTVLSIILLHQNGHETSGVAITIGIILFFVGVIILSFGCWLGLWAPINQRNTNNGIKFILLGALSMILSVILMSMPDKSLGFQNSGNLMDSPALTFLFSAGAIFGFLYAFIKYQNFRKAIAIIALVLLLIYFVTNIDTFRF